jgi:hypothetical protein
MTDMNCTYRPRSGSFVLVLLFVRSRTRVLLGMWWGRNKNLIRSEMSPWIFFSSSFHYFVAREFVLLLVNLELLSAMVRFKVCWRVDRVRVLGFEIRI